MPEPSAGSVVATIAAAGQLDRRVSRTCSSSARSWVTRSRVPSKPSSAASSCSIAGRSRWFVGSSSTSTLAPFAISSASDARVRSPGDSVAAGRVTWSATRPNLASSVRTSAASHPVASWNARSSDGAVVEPVAGLLDLADDDARPDRAAARRRARPGRAGRRAASSCPTRWRRRWRSARRRRSSRSIGPSRNEPRSTTAPSSRATTSPLRPGDGTDELQLPRLARLVDDLEPLDRPLGAGGPAGELLGLVDPEGADVLVRLVRAAAPWPGPGSPTPAPAGPAGPATGAGRRTPRSAPTRGGGRPPARRGSACQPPAKWLARWVNSSSSTTWVTVRARNVRSWLTRTTAAVEPGDPALEPVEPVEVEVVGRLVEQEHVEAGEQQGGQARPGRLAAGQRRRRLVEQPRRQPEVGPHLADAGVEVGAAERRASGRARRRSGRRRRAGWRRAPPSPRRARRGRPRRRCGGRGTRARSRRRRAPAPGAGSRRSRSAACASTRPRSSGDLARRAPAAASSCRRRWARRRRCAGRARRRGRRRRARSAGRGRRSRSRARSGAAAGTPGQRSRSDSRRIRLPRSYVT